MARLPDKKALVGPSVHVGAPSGPQPIVGYHPLSLARPLGAGTPPCTVPSTYRLDESPLKVAAARCQLPSVTVLVLVTSDGTSAPSALSVTTPHTNFPDPSIQRSRSLSGDPVSNCELERLKMVPLAPGAALNQASKVKLAGVE